MTVLSKDLWMNRFYCMIATSQPTWYKHVMDADPRFADAVLCQYCTVTTPDPDCPWDAYLPVSRSYPVCRANVTLTNCRYAQEVLAAGGKRLKMLGGFPNPAQCIVCRRTAPKCKLCKVCRRTYYCSPECQKQDWSLHQDFCYSEKRMLRDIAMLD